MNPFDLQVIFEILPDAYLILDNQLNIVEASNSYLQLTMVKRKDILGKYAFDVFPENKKDTASNSFNKAFSSFHRVLANKKTDMMDLIKYDIRRPESQGGVYEERYWSVINTPVILGDEVAYIIHRVENITEKVLSSKQFKLANEQLSKANFALAEGDLSKLKLAAIVSSTKDAIVSATMQGIISSWNKGAEYLYGYQEQEILGKHISILFPPEHQHELDNELLEIKKGNSISFLETERKHKNGRIIPISVSISPIKNQDNIAIGFCAISRDISQWKKHRATILNQAKKIQELTLPILQLSEGLLLLPIIGTMDEQRTRQMTEKLLQTIRQKRARIILIDLTGVPSLDTRVANLLLQSVEATRLMGAEIIVTGFSADVAETMVELNVDFSQIKTLIDLQSGIEAANQMMEKLKTYKTKEIK